MPVGGVVVGRWRWVGKRQSVFNNNDYTTSVKLRVPLLNRSSRCEPLRVEAALKSIMTVGEVLAAGDYAAFRTR